MMAVKEAMPFMMERLGVIMEPDRENPCEAWGVLNPGGARGPDGEYYLFPRVVAEGNYSRIGRARVIFDANGDPSGAERLGYALEPHEPYEVSKRLGGGVEDPRVAYVEPLRLYVMTYTAFTPHHPRMAARAWPSFIAPPMRCMATRTAPRSLCPRPARSIWRISGSPMRRWSMRTPTFTTSHTSMSTRSCWPPRPIGSSLRSGVAHRRYACLTAGYCSTTVSAAGRARGRSTSGTAQVS